MTAKMAVVTCALALAGLGAPAFGQTVTISDAIVNEGDTAWFHVTITSTSLTQPISIHWTTSDFTAKAGSDYSESSGVFTAPGVYDIPVQTISDEVRGEGSEVFFVTLDSSELAHQQWIGRGVIHDEQGPMASKCDLDGQGGTDLVTLEYMSPIFGGGPAQGGVWGIDGPIAGGNPPLAFLPEMDNWVRFAMNDFDGDGSCDLVWWRLDTLDLALALSGPSGGLSVPGPEGTLPTRLPAASWALLGTGQLSGDQRADLLWWNASTRNLRAWIWSGAAGTLPPAIDVQNIKVTDTAVGEPIAVVKLGPGTGTGILWRNASGALAYWRLNGLVVANVSALPYPPASRVTTEWHLVAVGDFDRDGREDLVWQGPPASPISGGPVVIWFMRDPNVPQETPLNPEYLVYSSPELPPGSYLPGFVDGPR